MSEADRMIWGRLRWLVAITVLALVTGGPTVSRVEARSSARLTPPDGLDVQPFPGTPDASPQTDVGFPALAPDQIKTLRVIGSRSGPHAGRLTELGGGSGAAFVPARPFAPGEQVFVRATLSSPAAGTASGAPGQTHLRFSFGIAITVPHALAALASAADGSAVRDAASIAVNPGVRSFYSEPWLHPPIAHVSGTDPDPGQGDIFGDVENSLQVGPLILSPQGQLVYFQPLQHAVGFDVSVQQYQGQSVLTYWQGPAIDFGHGVILNHSYQQVATVYAGNGDYADAHEFQITPQGDALISVYAPVRANLSSIGGPRHGILMDSIIQEIDIATGQVIWEWHASGHVALRMTYAPKPGVLPYDYFHINSIQQLPGDRLLVSGRNTWSLYEIDMRTGKIKLVIGGKHSSLKMEPGTNFEWQHDARMQPDGTITVFDNGSDGGDVGDEPESRALRIRLELRHRRAALVRAFTDRPPLLATSQGSVEPLGDGTTFIEWGTNAYFTEFSASGAELFNVYFDRPVASYRGLRFQWWGQPSTPPWAAAVATASGTTLYASWNGATTVDSWQVLAGPSAAALSPVAQFPKTSFETTMSVASTAPYFAVQALGENGQLLGTSAPVAR